MSERPDLNKELDAQIFRSFYYLKEELVSFCRENNLPVSGGKIELTERQLMIADVTDDGKVDIQDLRKELRYVCGKISTLD